MRIMQAIPALFTAAACWASPEACAQNLITSRSFAGTAELIIIRPASGSIARQTVAMDVQTGPFSASFAIYREGASPITATYGLLEVGRNPVMTRGFFMRGPDGANSVLPRTLVSVARVGPEGSTTLIAMGAISGVDAAGSFQGLVVMVLQQVVIVPPTPPTPEPPLYPLLPSFDGVTLRVPAAWRIQKFEGWAQRLAAKYGTLPGGTSATVPASWRDGVMQCHSDSGFVYEIPLTLSYVGFPQNSILYVTDGHWPSWESPESWRAIATGPGHTKYINR